MTLDTTALSQLILKTSLMAKEGQESDAIFLYLSIEIEASIMKGDLGQPNILATLVFPILLRMLLTVPIVIKNSL